MESFNLLWQHVSNPFVRIAEVFDGYHYDVMSEQEIEFESKVEVNNPKHTFAGY